MIYLPFFFFSDTATTEIYTLSLHDALPISKTRPVSFVEGPASVELASQHVSWPNASASLKDIAVSVRSEEHTSELQSHSDIVCRLLLEKKNEARFSASARNRKSDRGNPLT